MDLFDLALKFKDYEWAEELLKEMQNKIESDAEQDSSRVFDEKAVALEDLVTECAIIEKNGIRQFNIFSDYDRNEAEIVIIENPPYARGDSVMYYVPSENELAYMKATTDGYLLGYRDAVHMMNTQHEMVKKKAGRKKSSNVKSKRKSNKNKEQEQKDNTPKS